MTADWGRTEVQPSRRHRPIVRGTFYWMIQMSMSPIPGMQPEMDPDREAIPICQLLQKLFIHTVYWHLLQEEK